MARNPNDTITADQLELIALVASGHTLTKIAELKFMHINTVRYQLAQAVERTEAANVTDLVICCAVSGLLVRNGAGYKPVQERQVIA